MSGCVRGSLSFGIFRSGKFCPPEGFHCNTPSPPQKKTLCRGPVFSTSVGPPQPPVRARMERN